MANASANANMDSRQQNLEHSLSREPFTGLKAILDSLSCDRDVLSDAIGGADSYEGLLAKVGYRVVLTKQIHVQDAFSRLGPAGGIKAVLPYYDIPTQRSLPTLVNYDSTVTTTPESVVFFNQLLADLRKASRSELHS